MFKPAENQVAGHKAEPGKLGPVVDSSGKFYKPLQNGERGLKEKHFYEKMSADESVPGNIKLFFPTYYGTVEIEASDGSGLLEHLVLEDLTHNYQKPCVMDLKMGIRTWHPGATEKYIAKCIEKDKQSTSPVLGFRISGLQVYDTVTAKLWKPSRQLCKSLDVNDTKSFIVRFVSTNPTNDEIHDAALAPKVYGGSRGLINQLKELQIWFQSQTTYHFYSSSVLFMYESDETPDADLLPCLKMVDFAHVVTDDPTVDENVLKGIDSLITILEDIVNNPKDTVGSDIVSLDTVNSPKDTVVSDIKGLDTDNITKDTVGSE